MQPSAHMHHVHLFAKHIDETIAWYQRNLAAEVKFDGDFGGARNVFMQIGSGRINLYDQPPRGIDATAGGAAGGRGRTGAYHHVGIQTDNLVALRERLLNNGVQFRSEIREFGSWRYLMCPAPDDVLLELFQIDVEEMPPALAEFFTP